MRGNTTMSRPILTAVNHFCIFPFNFGGALAIRGLYKGLSEWFDINIITLYINNININLNSFKRDNSYKIMNMHIFKTNTIIKFRIIFSDR